MAIFEPRVPSEDEDFDAVLTPKRPRKPRTLRPVMTSGLPYSAVKTNTTVVPTQPVVARPTPVAAPRPVPVSVVDEPAIVAEITPEVIPVATHEQASYQPDREPLADVDADEPNVPEFFEPLNQPVTATTVAETQPKPPQPPRAALTRSFRGRLLVEAVLVMFVVGLGILSWQLYTDRKDLRSQVSSLQANPQAIIQKQTEQLIQRVGQLMALPTGETPTIANVSDVTQARQQSAFFTNAQNGDKVLMYVKAGEAILYRPNTNKIVLVAPLTFNSGGAAPAKN